MFIHPLVRVRAQARASIARVIVNNPTDAAPIPAVRFGRIETRPYTAGCAGTSAFPRFSPSIPVFVGCLHGGSEFELLISGAPPENAGFCPSKLY